MGILGYGLYILLGITSLPSVSNALSWREFSFIQVDTGMCVWVMICGYLDVLERESFSVSIHGDTLWTQNTELYFSCAGCCAAHKKLAESLHPVYCLLVVTTGGKRLWDFFITASSGVGHVVSQAICPTAFPFCTYWCLCLSVFIQELPNNRLCS